jgi:quercetin dioxygenase-like cupin family protein
MKIQNYNDAMSTMYPATSQIINKTGVYEIPEGASIYGYVISGSAKIFDKDELVAVAGPECVFATSFLHRVEFDAAKVWIVTRHGFKTPLTVTKPEVKGRLTYIDGCSDSLLIYPPRKGDGSLNLLYFPPNVDQTWHRHPSVRLGHVASGKGFAEWKDKDGMAQTKKLETGDTFIIGEQVSHRFCTEDSEMRILAFHPDGDWGPEDKNHAMINRTYIAST